MLTSPKNTILISILFTAISGCASNQDIELDVNNHFQTLNDKWVNSPATKTALNFLLEGRCPSDKSNILAFKLPASGSYVDISKTAHVCINSSQYWVSQEQGAFLGNKTAWYGPFSK